MEGLWKTRRHRWGTARFRRGSVWRRFSYGCVRALHIEPPFFLEYYGFEWTPPWPSLGTHLLFAALGAPAPSIMPASLAPARKAFSLDASMRPAARPRTAPAWAVGALAAQMGSAYFFGGAAKLNADWLRGEPMRTDFPSSGNLHREWAACLFSRGGHAFDLFIVPLLA